LNLKKLNKNVKIYIGTSGYTYNHWVNIFYPASIKKSKWFEFYQKHFNAVEINATFYRDFTEKTYEKWKNKSLSDFKYFLKVPRLITHIKMLNDVKLDVERFYNTTKILDNKLGGYLLQLHPKTPKNPELLKETIQYFKNSLLIVEFRNKLWFSDDIINLLKINGTVLCNVQSPEIDLNDIITSNFAYIRLHGIKSWYSYNYTEDDLKHIVNLIKYYKNNDIREVYVFFNNDFNGFAPLNALKLKEILKMENLL